MQVLSIGKKKRVYAIAFSPDGHELAAICGDYRLRVWTLATGEVRLAEWPVSETPSGYDLAYLDSERLIVSGNNLMWWESATDKWYVISAARVWGRRFQISPTGALLAQVDQMRSTHAVGDGLILRSTADWAVQPPLPEAANTTGGLAFSRDGRFLASGHMAEVGHRPRSIAGYPALQLQVPEYDYLVHVREMPTDRVVQTLAGWQQAITHLAFSPDGNVIAGTAGPRLRVWDRQADRELALHKRGPKHFQGLSFAHDGSFLATVSNDATVRIWETQTWQEHTTFTWKIGALLNIRFAPDGLRAAAGSDRGQIVVWDVQ